MVDELRITDIARKSGYLLVWHNSEIIASPITLNRELTLEGDILELIRQQEQEIEAPKGSEE